MIREYLPVIAGLAAGSALVLLFASQLPPTSNNSDKQARDNNNARQVVEFQTKYNHTQIPDLHMIVKSEGKRYAGEEGSYCWRGVCADYGKIVPQNTITIDKGAEIEFRIQNYRTPEMFGVYASQEPQANHIWGEDSDNETNTVTKNFGLPDEIPPLTRLGNDFTYGVDLPDGVYTLMAGANWMTEDGYGESDASYVYRINVK